MKDYQQKKMKSHVLPQPVYRQALWAVKDLLRLQERLEELRRDAYAVGERKIQWYGGGYKGGFVCDATGGKAVEIANISWRIDAIVRAFDSVPEKYRKGIENKLVHDVPYDDQCHPNTWKRWQQVFLYNVAENLCILKKNKKI